MSFHPSPCFRHLALAAAVLASTSVLVRADTPATPGASETLVVPPGGRLELTNPADPGLVYEAALDGGLLMPVSAINAPEAGRHWLTVVSRDAAGNLSAPRFLQLWVDGEPPHLSFEVLPQPVQDTIRRFWVPPGARVEASAEDRPAGVEKVVLSIGGREVSDTDSIQQDLPDTGQAELQAWAIDTVGNRTETATLTLLVDAEPPRGDIRLQGDQWIEQDVEGRSMLVAPPTLQLQARVSDPETGVDRWTPRLNGEEVDLSTWRRQEWPAGRYRAEVTASDRVGNTADLPALEFIVDAEGPALDWQITSEGVERDGAVVYRPPVTLQMTARDDVAGVAALEWPEGDSLSAQPAKQPIAQAELRVDGDRLTVTTTDLVGNMAEHVLTWSIDREAPGFRLRKTDGTLVSPGERVELLEGEAVHVEAFDDGAGIASQEVAVDGIHWTGMPREVRFPHRGFNRLEVRAVDRLGHSSTAVWPIEVRAASGETRR